MARKVGTRKRPESASTKKVVVVPQDVKVDVDDVWQDMQANPENEGFVEFDTASEQKLWLAQAKVYCASLGLNLRKLPAGKSGLTATQMRFQITVAEDESASENGSADSSVDSDSAKSKK